MNRSMQILCFFYTLSLLLTCLTQKKTKPDPLFFAYKSERSNGRKKKNISAQSRTSEHVQTSVLQSQRIKGELALSSLRSRLFSSFSFSVLTQRSQESSKQVLHINGATRRNRVIHLFDDTATFFRFSFFSSLFGQAVVFYLEIKRMFLSEQA